MLQDQVLKLQEETTAKDKTIREQELEIAEYHAA